MSLAWKRFRVYFRLIIAIVVLGAIGLVLIKNKNHTVKVWFFGLVNPQSEINVLWVILWTALFTRIAWFLMSFSLHLWQDYREVKKADLRRELDEQQKRREADLLDREQRLRQAESKAQDQNELKAWGG